MTRYETSVERSLRRALLDLERRQARRRKGEGLAPLLSSGKDRVRDETASLLLFPFSNELKIPDV